jgi:hypothetical protein
MRLISVTVNNYRIHKEQTVTFHAARTVIGGPNGSSRRSTARCSCAAARPDRFSNRCSRSSIPATLR